MLLKDLTTLTASLASGTLFHVEKSGKAYNIDYTKLAKAIVEEYNGSTLGGSAQTVQAAIGALNSSLRKYVVTTGEKTYEIGAVSFVFIGQSSNSARIFMYSNSMITILAGSADSDVVITPVDTTHIKITNNHTWI
jgi:hypothetical protein